MPKNSRYLGEIIVDYPLAIIETVSDSLNTFRMFLLSIVIFLLIPPIVGLIFMFTTITVGYFIFLFLISPPTAVKILNLVLDRKTDREFDLPED